MICWREHQHRVCTDSQQALPAANGQSSDGQHGSVKGQCRCQGAFQLLELSEAGLRLTLTVSRGWLQPVGKLTGCRPPANGQGKGQHPRGKQACCPLAGHTPQLCQHQRHAQTKTIGQTDRQTDRQKHTRKQKHGCCQGQFNKVLEPVCKTDKCLSLRHSRMQMGQMHDDMVTDHSNTIQTSHGTKEKTHGCRQPHDSCMATSLPVTWQFTAKHANSNIAALSQQKTI